MAKAVVFFAEGTEECEALLVVEPAPPRQGGGAGGQCFRQPGDFEQP